MSAKYDDIMQSYPNPINKGSLSWLIGLVYPDVAYKEQNTNFMEQRLL